LPAFANPVVTLLPAYIMCVFLLDILGRRPLMSGLMIGGGVVCISSMLLREFGTEDTGKN